ncbi:unnamed protein product [Lactuca virosa]|uniref:Uncharacterized protein n=1 Tax=Lactuca virosa TaxID=75947 RepID=A0AAU9NEM3_9ASTR|nr:unnamed protein product [Lactuca virosa]
MRGYQVVYKLEKKGFLLLQHNSPTRNLEQEDYFIALHFFHEFSRCLAPTQLQLLISMHQHTYIKFPIS